MRFALLLLLGVAACQSAPTAAAPSHLPDDVSLAVTDMDGVERDLDATLAQGRVALVFWQTWCASCREEAPHLIRAAREHTGIEFVGVISGPDDAVDDNAVRKAAADWGLPYPQVRDRKLELTRGLGVTVTPTIVVLGAGREILYYGHQPPADWAALR
jgi:thiol-disulfide isomerase/thioredoxin